LRLITSTLDADWKFLRAFASATITGRELAQVSRQTPHKCLSTRIEFKLGYASYIWMSPGLFLNVEVHVLLAIHRLSKTRLLPPHRFRDASLLRRGGRTLRPINLVRAAMILREFRTRTINPDVVFGKSVDSNTELYAPPSPAATKQLHRCINWRALPIQLLQSIMPQSFLSIFHFLQDMENAIDRAFKAL